MNKDYASFVYYKILHLEMKPEEKYNYAFENYKDFTMAFPLIVKYMCFYSMFDADLFEELIKTLEKEKPKYMEHPKFHGVYLKNLAIKKGVAKHLANKMTNMEVAAAEIQLNKIKKQEKEFKRQKENQKKENIEDLRKEFTEFCMNL